MPNNKHILVHDRSTKGQGCRQQMCSDAAGFVVSLWQGFTSSLAFSSANSSMYLWLIMLPLPHTLYHPSHVHCISPMH